MTDHNDRRDEERFPCANHVVILYKDRAWLTELRDVSEGGCRIAKPKEWPLLLSEVVTLAFYYELGPMVTVGARVAWASASHVGFEYHRPQRIPPVAEPELDVTLALAGSEPLR